MINIDTRFGSKVQSEVFCATLQHSPNRLLYRVIAFGIELFQQTFVRIEFAG